MRCNLFCAAIVLALCVWRTGDATENNFVKNGGFEDDLIAGWELPDPGAGLCQRDTELRHSGTAALKLKSPGETGITIQQVLPSGIRGDIQVEVFVMVSAEYNGSQPKITVLCELSNGKTSPFTVRCKTEKEKWSRTEEVICLSEGVKQVKLCFSIDGNRGYVWLDDVIVKKADTSYQLLE